MLAEYKNSDMCTAINEYVRNTKYREVLRLRFCEGRTYDEIARMTNFSAQHVKYICKSYYEMLIRHL